MWVSKHAEISLLFAMFYLPVPLPSPAWSSQFHRQQLPRLETVHLPDIYYALLLLPLMLLLGLCRWLLLGAKSSTQRRLWLGPAVGCLAWLEFRWTGLCMWFAVVVAIVAAAAASVAVVSIVAVDWRLVTGSTKILVCVCVCTWGLANQLAKSHK